MSIDPILFDTKQLKKLVADPLLLNSYSYSRNNPLTLFDPSGELVELIGRYINDSKVGVHTFIALTNIEASKDLLNALGYPEADIITLGGYTNLPAFLAVFGDLVKGVNDPTDVDILNNESYIFRYTIEKPNQYESQEAFENKIIENYIKEPQPVAAYGITGSNLSGQQNCNNFSSNLLMKSGVDKSVFNEFKIKEHYNKTAGLGRSIKSYRATSIYNHYLGFARVGAAFINYLKKDFIYDFL